MASDPEMSAAEQDKKTQAQLDSIALEIKATQPLTSDLISIHGLKALFDDGTNFKKGCTYLSQSYASYRAIRGDGNCYYRAFLYCLCEKIFAEKGPELKRIMDYVKSSIDTVVQFGYDRFAIEMFHEEMVDLLEALSCNSDFEIIHKMLNEENATSDYCVWYLRVITSAYLKADGERFIHFLDDPNYFDIPTFCSREIDPMGREINMVGVLALAEAFSVKVEIEYLDGREMKDGKLTKHSFGNETSSLIFPLLYRPGHYDILY